MAASASTEAVASVAAADMPAVPADTPQPIATVAEAVVETAQHTVDTIADTVTKAAEPAATIIEEPTMIHTNDAATAANATADKAQTMFADMNARAKTAMEKGAKGFEELNDMAKGNVEAMVESGRIAAKGLESLGQDAAEFGRKSFENATATMKTLASVKSPTEFFKLQSDFFRSSFDSFVAEASKNTEAMLKLAGDAAQPISNRVAVAAEKAKIAA